MKILCAIGLALCALTLFSAKAYSQQDAPLGLTWGVSASDVRAQGVELTKYAGTDYGNSFLAAKLEKALADQEGVLLSFGFNDKLWRIVIISRQFKNDPQGLAVLARYTELSEVMAEKYGKPIQYHRLGDSIYSQPKYFLAGINGGNSRWYSNFNTPSLSIQLSVGADDSSTARWRAFYENKPLEKEFEAAKKSREKGSL